MKQSGKSFVGLAAVFVICFAVFLAYISLLGENNKIDTLIDQFFETLQEQQYFSLKDNMNIVENRDVFDLGGDYSENCLLLELALMEKYNLSDASDYAIKIRKSHFWLPFANTSDIGINISLKQSGEKSLTSLFKTTRSPESVNNLFTVARKNGRWLITAINIKETSLFESVVKLRDSLDIDSYISSSGTKLTIKPIEIDTRGISNIEKRKLKFIFRKLNQLTESSEEATDTP